MTRATRTFSQLGDGSYQLTVLELGLQLTVDRLRRDRHELVGELAVACDLPGAHTIDGFISVADFNLSSAHARQTRAKLLAERSEAADVDWLSLVEELCVRSIAADRQGAPSRPLHAYARAPQATDALLDVDGWPWLRDHAMITFADGGGLKSYLALYGAGVLSQRGLQVGFCDWELTGCDHRDRLGRLFPDALPLIHYFHCDKPLTDEVDRLTRDVRRLGLDYLVFDSAGFGTAGPPEAAEHALAYFRALRQIGVGSHLLAHVNRSETGDQKPFGSSYWHNCARATWFAKLSAARDDAGRLTVGLFNRKSNLTRLYAAVGFQFAFTEDRTIVERVNLADVDDLAGQLPTWQRVANFIKAGGGYPQTIAVIADTLEVKPNTVRKAVSLHSGKGRSVFTTVPGIDGGEVRIALAERRFG